ncbi:DNA glycosylase [Lasiosphaeria ovina]|uniref:DNA glycosylase n=1 Tax=Lasiosphaeria ovina TaxID=92902 RepID=A0AAE0NL99_9PEZI|nr:DNA glycosylase [Lasiosphaeria ovina]
MRTRAAARKSLQTADRTTENLGRATRKRKKDALPLKGDWNALPHGMGTVVNAVATQTTSHARSVLAVAPVSSYHGTPISTASTGSNTRQTRPSFRVTKARQGFSTKEQNTIKAQDDPDNTYRLTDLEDENPKKRYRIARSSVASSVKTETELTLRKPNQTTHQQIGVVAPHARKLLIIHGAVVKNTVAVKISASKITVDATQILDPDFKIKLKRGRDNPYGLTPGFSPYPYRQVPSREACEEVYAILTSLHGAVQQPEKMPQASLEIAGCGEVPCVLDALLRTLISGNTLMALANAAIKNLAAHYGICAEGTGAGSINWEKVRPSPHNELAQVIRLAGSGSKKSIHIKEILDMVYEESLERMDNTAITATTAQPDVSEAEVEPCCQTSTSPEESTRQLLSLDYMHSMGKDEAMAKFVQYSGIGIKTAACVTLFCLRMPCFAVDTHVHKFCRWLGWVDKRADPDTCFRHGEFMVPDHLKYGLHQLFIRHGQQCFKCRKATRPGSKDWAEAPECPLEHLLDRDKDDPVAGEHTEEPDMGVV